MKLNSFIKLIEEIAPLKLQEEWDNSGIQVRSKDIVKRVLVCLDVTDEIIDEAIDLECDMILTHHPLLFNSLSSVDSKNITGNYIAKLIKNNISVYSSHTPFDKCKGGNNDYLAKLLGLTNVKPMSGDESHFTRIGKLKEEAKIKDIIDLADSKLGINKSFIKLVGNPDKKIKKIGLCTGAGADFIDLAIKNKCDLYITGDVKYHEAMDAKANGIQVLDLGHYGTEYLFKENMTKLLLDTKAKNLPELVMSRVNANPFSEF